MRLNRGKGLIVILGDQLNPNIAALKGARKARDTIIMGELRAETDYAPHHKKKIAFLFAAMRHFADDLRAKSWRVDYAKLDDKGAPKTFTALVEAGVKRHRPDEIIVTEPGEHRVLAEIKSWEKRFSTPVDIRADDRFVCTHDEFNAWADGRKTLRMEYFYREMRKKTGLLMRGDEPEGGQWNFDAENRKPAKAGLSITGPARFEPDEITNEVLDLVARTFPDNFGAPDDFWFATTRQDALCALDHFINTALASFGDYQDAMLQNEKFLFHSVLSLYLNAGLLEPLEICARAEKAYQDGAAPINAVEGFIRQIIGWREFVRGIYWREGTDYTRKNFYNAQRALPDFYWTGETKMNCMRAAITQTRNEAYAHHIQRLMVTGNFALLAGINPREVHEWYLGVYADAFEWVEAPNVIGMSQFADGGGLASKPYAASGAYINRMSDYCSHCDYAVTKKFEDNACPFNALYWDFMARHEQKHKNNPRLGPVYRNWARMDANKKRALRARARDCLKQLEEGAL